MHKQMNDGSQDMNCCVGVGVGVDGTACVLGKGPFNLCALVRYLLWGKMLYQADLG